MKTENYYLNKFNRVLKFINENLANDISIQDLARESQFSLFHFHRLFTTIYNESPYDLILRLRLEKAVFLLKYHQELKILDVAFQCGFQSASNFSRQFKSRFNISPNTFKKEKKYHNSKIYHEFNPFDFYHCYEESRKKEYPDFEVKIEMLPKLNLVMNRAVFGKDGSILLKKYNELIEWANEKKVPYQGPMRRLGMSIDNPEVTPAGKYRYDFAIIIDKDYELGPPLERGFIEAGKFATLHCKGKIETVAQAWDYLYKIWLPDSGYIPKHQPALEEYIQGPEEIGWEDFNIKCRVPIMKPNKYE